MRDAIGVIFKVACSWLLEEIPAMGIPWGLYISCRQIQEAEERSADTVSLFQTLSQTDPRNNACRHIQQKQFVFKGDAISGLCFEAGRRALSNT